VDHVDGLTHHLRPAAGEPEGALVLFHGRATSEEDLLPLLDVLDPERRLVGVTPGGPLSLPRAPTAQPLVGRHWYEIRELGFPDPATFGATHAQVSGFLDALAEETGIAAGKTVLGGFSQGAVMAYALGLGTSRPAPAGILALSGFMPTVDGLAYDLEGRAGVPVAIGHGTHDPVIGVEWGRRAEQTLTTAGFDVLYRESPVPHTLDPRELPTFTEWVRRATERAA